jgi:uncharacterized protein YbaR (Trm112 family)
LTRDGTKAILPFGGLIALADREPVEIDPKMLEMLVCPLTKGNLTYDRTRNELVSRLARLAYPVRDGIPILLPSEARVVEE